MSLNPLGVDFPNNDSSEICMVCHDLLNTAATYTLPECKHQFHTHCIVTWFRHGRSQECVGSWHRTEDGRCPHCGNTGINNITVNESKYRSAFSMTSKEQQIYKINKKEGIKKDAPKIVKNEIKKLDKASKLLNNMIKENAQYRKTIKECPVNFNETYKKLRENKKKLWLHRRKIRDIKKRITCFPIIPLIIPTPVDIN